MTTVRVEAIHPKCLASLPGPQVLAGCECKEWEGHQSWWLCAHHDSFNDGCWAVADAEPTTVGQMFDAMRLISLPCSEMDPDDDVQAYFMPGDCFGSIWWQDGRWSATDIVTPTASKFDRFEDAVRHLYEERKKNDDLVKGNQ